MGWEVYPFGHVWFCLYYIFQLKNLIDNFDGDCVVVIFDEGVQDDGADQLEHGQEGTGDGEDDGDRVIDGQKVTLLLKRSLH